MLVRQGYQYATCLMAHREVVLRRWVGCRCFVFNEALSHRRAEMAAGRQRSGYSALCARLPALKVAHPWLAEPPAEALQQALKDLCKAWDARFAARLGAPRFKRKGQGDTLRLPQDCRYDAAAGTLHLPKLGALRLCHSREALGKLENLAPRQERGRWITSLQTQRELEPAAPAATAAAGLDFGAATTILRRTQQQLGDSAEAGNQLGDCSASTAGPAGTNACEGGRRRLQIPRLRSAARDGLGIRLAEPSLVAGTHSELGLSGHRHVRRRVQGWRGGKYAEASKFQRGPAHESQSRRRIVLVTEVAAPSEAAQSFWLARGANASFG